MPIDLLIVCACFHTALAEFNSVADCMACRTANDYDFAFYRKACHFCSQVLYSDKEFHSEMITEGRWVGGGEGK